MSFSAFHVLMILFCVAIVLTVLTVIVMTTPIINYFQKIYIARRRKTMIQSQPVPSPSSLEFYRIGIITIVVRFLQFYLITFGILSSCFTIYADLESSPPSVLSMFFPAILIFIGLCLIILLFFDILRVISNMLKERSKQQ